MELQNGQRELTTFAERERLRIGDFAHLRSAIIQLTCGTAMSRERERKQNFEGKLPKDLRTPRAATEPRNGPTWNFYEKYRKNTPRPEILDSQNLAPKYPENTEKIPPKYQKMCILVFFRYFGGIFLGFQNLGPGVIFSVFFVEIPGHLGAL